MYLAFAAGISRAVLRLYFFEKIGTKLVIFSRFHGNGAYGAVFDA
jgi:hypothetical protein